MPPRGDCTCKNPFFEHATGVEFSYLLIESHHPYLLRHAVDLDGAQPPFPNSEKRRVEFARRGEKRVLRKVEKDMGARLPVPSGSLLLSGTAAHCQWWRQLTLQVTATTFSSCCSRFRISSTALGVVKVPPNSHHDSNNNNFDKFYDRSMPYTVIRNLINDPKWKPFSVCRFSYQSRLKFHYCTALAVCLVVTDTLLWCLCKQETPRETLQTQELGPCKDEDWRGT